MRSSCHRGFLLALAMLCLGSASAQDNETSFRRIHRDLASQDLNVVAPIAASDANPPEVKWQQSFERHGFRYLRFQLGGFAGDENAEIELHFRKEPLGELLAKYTWKELVAAGDGFLTTLLPAGRIRLQIVQGRVGTAGSVRIEKLHWKAPSMTLDPQSPAARDKLLETFPASHLARRLAPSVAMLHIGPTGVTCTGFLIAPGKLATNHHCIEYSLRFQKSKADQYPACGDVLVEFDYTRPDIRGKTAVCTRVGDRSQPEDFAILELADTPLSESGAPRTPLNRGKKLDADTVLTILHYPRGLPLAVEIQCLLQRVEGNDVLHNCQTSSGSSGSALFDDAGAALGIHYKAAYPLSWTLEQVENDRVTHGPRYNRAKPISVIGAP
jgi:V8-like Glu-specific endopeptidase